MSKLNVENAKKPESVKGTQIVKVGFIGEPDPYATASEAAVKRAEERDNARHKIVMLMYKILPPIIFVFGVMFLIALFFIIMPFSAMELNPAYSPQEWLRDYSRAFLDRLGNFGVTVVAIIVSELLKTAYRLIKHKRDE